MVTEKALAVEAVMVVEVAGVVMEVEVVGAVMVVQVVVTVVMAGGTPDPSELKVGSRVRDNVFVFFFIFLLVNWSEMLSS